MHRTQLTSLSADAIARSTTVRTNVRGQNKGHPARNQRPERNFNGRNGEQRSMSFTDRFTSRAGAYVASRPSYPPASIDAIFAGLGDPAMLAVADLGAGTGISSRLLAARGCRVFAVEPNAAMRAAAESGSGISWIDGTAERTTLADRAVDIVTAFQAWHWVDHPVALAEARRILRKRGRLAIVYNERDERDAFTAQYGEVVRRHATDATEQRRANALARAFGIDPPRTARAEFRNEQIVDRAGAHARAESSSYLPQSGPAAAALHADIEALLDRFAITDTIGMHLVTSVVCVDLGDE
jgi:ubiquinone/menaquinone biosynthesis C-methylase UbiE